MRSTNCPLFATPSRSKNKKTNKHGMRVRKQFCFAASPQQSSNSDGPATSERLQRRDRAQRISPRTHSSSVLRESSLYAFSLCRQQSRSCTSTVGATKKKYLRGSSQREKKKEKKATRGNSRTRTRGEIL